jgi:hypothetical protein
VQCGFVGRITQYGNLKGLWAQTLFSQYQFQESFKCGTKVTIFQQRAMTSRAKVKIRFATINDIEAITDLHCSSFRPQEHIPVMLGRNYVRATFQWQVSGGQSYVLVAELGNSLAGYVGVSDTAFTKPMFKACVSAFVQCILRRPFLLLQGALWKRAFRGPRERNGKNQDLLGKPAVAQMIIGAVDARFRGYGVFPQLVESTRVASKARGSNVIVAGIYKQNSASRRVFVKSGWSELPDLETADTVFYVSWLDRNFRKNLQRPSLPTGNSQDVRE